MGRNPERQIDRTFLSIDTAEERGLVHRDYIAHCFRWSHVVKHLNQKHRYKDAVVLDVGCGKELPLAKLMYVNKMTPLQYVGVDANKAAVPNMLKERIPIKLWFDTDFCNLEVKDVSIWDEESNSGVKPNVLVCFEVLEHVPPAHCRRMLKHMLELTSEFCNYFISTPCYNGSPAENHLNETTASALGALLEDVGFAIRGVWGTFASIRDYESELSNWTYYWDDEPGVNHEKTPKPHTMDLRPLFSLLSTYYDTNALSTIFAPLFPMQSRNCLWHLTKQSNSANTYQRKFPPLSEVPGPWSQHPNWRELAG